MTKKQFLAILRKVIRAGAESQIASCRCVGCCEERRKRQSMIENVSLKPSCKPR